MPKDAPPPPIRILCVDDHRIVLEGLTLIIDREADMTVVGTASSGEEAVALHRELRPDVTLMDLQLGTMSGLEATRAIRQEQPDSRIVVLTMYQGDEDIYRALASGAATYLLKDTLSDDLIRIVREVYDGSHPLRHDIAARLASRAAGPTLTPREMQVIELIAEGMRNKAIAARLDISEETVHVHVRNIMMKLETKDRTASVVAAQRKGIIHLR